MALHIYIDTIPHSEQRYPTVGDYWRPKLFKNAIERLEVRVSDLGNEDYEFLVAIHELIEEHLTKKRGIPEEAITKFDIAFEQHRQTNSIEEPGDSPDAPYKCEHFFATSIERLIAAELGVDWLAYSAKINSLFKVEEDFENTPDQKLRK